MVLNIYRRNNKISLSPKIRIENLRKLVFNYRNFKNDNLYKILYNSNNCINYGTSTWSIFKIYQFFKSSKKNTVLIPDYICNDSLSLLRLNNANIIFYPYEKLESSLFINKILNENILFLLFVNYFGEYKKISKQLREILKQKKIILVEDNTHCINAINQIQSDIEIYSPHKLFGIDNGSVIKFKSNKLFKDFLGFYIKDLNDINNKFGNFFRFCLFIFKKEIMKLIGYRYPKLDFQIPDQSIIKKKHHIGIFSNSLLNIYSKDLKNYKKRRIKNYYLWKNNLNIILPFLKLEDINYSPYLGIAKFKPSKERIEILKNYNLYSLPIGTWPDLPPEIIGDKLYIKAVEKFKTQITFPVHQDISAQNIQECIRNSFEKFVNSFNFIYHKNSKIITIYKEKKVIGIIQLVDTNIKNIHFMKLDFSKYFLNTFDNSKKFIYIFSLNILSRIKTNDSILIQVPKNYNSYLNQNKLIKYKDPIFILPLNITSTKIKDLIHIMLQRISKTKYQKIEYLVNILNLENTIYFKLHNEQTRSLPSNFQI